MPDTSSTSRHLDGSEQPEALLLTPEEAARVLRVGRTTIYALMKGGDLHAVHIGRSCRLSRAELEQFVGRLEAPQAPPRQSGGRRRMDPNQRELLQVDDKDAVDPDACGFGRTTRHQRSPHSRTITTRRTGDDRDRRR